MRVGITPIISIIILLLIAISMASSAWIFISNYWSSRVDKVIQMVPGFEKGNRFMIQNIGENSINSDEITVMVDGKKSIIMNPQPIDSTKTAIINFMPGDLLNPAGDVWELGPFGHNADVMVMGPTNSFSYNIMLDVEYIGNFLRNGDFELGDLTGWRTSYSHTLTVDGSDPHTGSNAGKVTGNSRVYSSDFIPYEPNDTVHIEFYAKSIGSGGLSLFYGGFGEYDKDKNRIYHYHVQYYENTKTTLAAALNPGQSTVSLSDGANWKDASYSVYKRYVGFWDTGDYPDYTYTRTIARYDDVSGNTVTLNEPWDGPTIPSGTSVANMYAGSGYNYVAGAAVNVPSDWTKYTGSVSGWKYGQTTSYSIFRYGTRYVSANFLFNYKQDDTYSMLFDDVRIWVNK